MIGPGDYCSCEVLVLAARMDRVLNDGEVMADIFTDFLPAIEAPNGTRIAMAEQRVAERETERDPA